MKAYKIRWSINRGTAVDLGYEYHLPRIECLDCCGKWKNWGQGHYEYPALKFDFLNDKEFNDKRVVSITEFQQIRARIERAANRSLMIMPGASIGMLAGKTHSKKLDDFVWGRISIPQISKSAADLLAQEGINLLTSECSILFCGNKIDSHLAIQVEPVSLLTEESLNKHKIYHCSRCGNYKSPPKPDPIVPEGYVIKRSSWPDDKHLVQMVETLKVIASEHFMQAVKKHKLTGITFEEYGQYV